MPLNIVLFASIFIHKSFKIGAQKIKSCQGFGFVKYEDAYLGGSNFQQSVVFWGEKGEWSEIPGRG